MQPVYLPQYSDREERRGHLRRRRRRAVGKWSDQELIDQYRLVRADSDNPHSSGAESEGGSASLDHVAEMSKRGMDPADLGMDPLATEP